MMPYTSLVLLVLSIIVVSNVHGQILPPITVGTSIAPSPGALYIAPNSRVASPPFAPSLMIVGNDGKPVASRFIPEYGFDFRILSDGRMGYSVFQSGGSGPRESSSIYLLDTNLIIVDSLKGVNGYNIAMHSFDVLPNGNRLLVMQENVLMNMSTIVPGGHPAATVQQMLIQEIDVHGNVLLQWRSLDHFPVTVSYEDLTAPSIRYFHLNSVTLDNDGHFLISARHASLVAKIHRKTGKVLWVLGGKLNQFTFSTSQGIEEDPLFSYQHDVIRHPNGNLTMFDNGTQRTPQWSRAVEYELNENEKTCKLVWRHRKSPDVYAGVQGSLQVLPNGNRVIAWGSALQNNRTLVTEVDVSNKEVYEIQLPSMMYPYKALRAPYPTGRHSADVLIDEILPTNTYTYSKGTDTVGLTITYHTLISFFYNTTTARRYMWAPENPKFVRLEKGNEIKQIPPYVIYPTRVTLTQEGMVDHAGEFRFRTDVLGISNPQNTLVYYRDSIGKGAFRALPTRYNPNTKQLIVDTAKAGEFCFGVASKDVADSIAPPKLIWPITGASVAKQRSFTLSLSPQGQTQFVSYQIRGDDGSLIVESTDKLTDKEIAPGMNPGTYYWRARSRYGSSVSDWSPLESFIVEDPHLKIKEPQAAAIWYHDSSHVLSWTTNVAVPVRLDLVKNNQVVTLIRDNIPAQQQGFLWKIPVSVPVGTDYKLRITPMDATLDSLVQETPFTIEIRGIPSSIKENVETPMITIGPNPTSNILYLGGQTPITRIMLFAADGTMVIDRNVRGTGDMLDLSEVAQGSYILRCETPNGQIQNIVIVAR